MKNTRQLTNRRKRRVITPAMSRSCAQRSRNAWSFSGSATPSLESYHNATTGKYRLVTLTQRVDQKQMPLMRVVDLRQERRKGKESRDSVRKIVASHCRSPRETRADDFVFESARFFHFAAVQQLRRSAQLSELQRRAHLSSAAGSRRTIELSFVRAHRRRAKKMSGLRTRRADLSRLRHGESGINRRADFSRKQWCAAWTPTR